ncbi:hypothetical protein E1B28_000230 [Marasmius oreades]|uniref:pH-response regulator protein palC n=1 Tax=Marasmius oreades TaxID=181124 RepID=A0A9P7V0Z2_9AGAR|nr:uncharacterized protein E1B28_000230 [Marasmius oreades]KAG7098268.1 hypothetical protein E1B28_000230 [Marasmius oreades]
MSTYLYELSTTAAFSFNDFCVDQSSNQAYTRHLSEATQIRANLRGALKESKRTDGEKDYLTLVKILDDYIPHLRSIMSCVAHDEIGLKAEPMFSWRTTLSATTNVFNSSPRLSIPSLHAEYATCLLTYAFVISNLARTIVASLGDYELDRAITEKERESKDERLKHAADFLSRASGIFAYISETVLVEWEHSPTSTSKFVRPPDLTKEVNSALAKLALADAQTLFIRKYLSKAAYESNISPGPPLPQSHPSPVLIAKLHLECSNYYSSARLLAKTPGSSGTTEASPELRHYLSDEAALHSALAKKWLAIDAGEKGGTEKGGDAVGLMIWAQKELQEMRDGGKSGGVSGLAKGEKEKKGRSLRKERIVQELESVAVWLKHYKKVNNTLHFQPVPSQADLQSRIPTGILAVSAKPYSPPVPVFGPGSPEYVQRQTDEVEFSSLSLNAEASTSGTLRDGLPHSDSTKAENEKTKATKATYAGAGSYF